MSVIRSTKRVHRRSTAALLIAGAALLLLGVTSVRASASDGRGNHEEGRTPTIVLVHGAWADPSSWSEVVERLHDEGYRTATPSLALQSVASDVATVRATLDGIPGKKILVGHSYGGFVITDAAAGRSDVLALVYSAAFLPSAGDTIVGMGAGFVPSQAFAHLIFTGTPGASPAYIDHAVFPYYFAQDLRAEDAAELNAAQRAVNLQIVGTPSGPVATLPSWYAVSGADRMIDPAQERWMAHRAGATVVEYPSASHVGGITVHAGQFTDLIERAARATADHDDED
jgi:pimeloyl-ACP methyl ester carboxylesterase